MNETEYIIAVMQEFANKYGIKALMKCVLKAIEQSEGKV